MPIPIIIGLAVAAAAAIAASQINAANTEADAEDEAGRLRDQQRKNTELDWYQKKAREAAAKRGAHNYQADALDEFRKQDNINAGYENAMISASRAADTIRTGGYINAGATVAGGIASGAFSAADTAASVVGSGLSALGGAGGASSRAQGYDLNPNDYGIGDGDFMSHQSTPLQATDPQGGFQLQEQDYRLLGGAGMYADSPYADDPYSVGAGFTNPRRKGFHL